MRSCRATSWADSLTGFSSSSIATVAACSAAAALVAFGLDFLPPFFACGLAFDISHCLWRSDQRSSPGVSLDMRQQPLRGSVAGSRVAGCR